MSEARGSSPLVMRCPKCRAGKLAPMGVAEDGREQRVFHVDQCGVCGGVWFELGELERYLKRRLTALHSPELHPKHVERMDAAIISCGRCAVYLEKVRPPVEGSGSADRCPRCGGVWLDAGEFPTTEPEPAWIFAGLRALFSKSTKGKKVK